MDRGALGGLDPVPLDPVPGDTGPFGRGDDPRVVGVEEALPLGLVQSGVVGGGGAFRGLPWNGRYGRARDTSGSVVAGLVPAPRLVREVVRDTHRMLLGPWYALLAVLVLTRFWSYWSTLL
ncbi:hypothetical protein GCM10027162_57780 [Streptomyces incanus]